MKKILLLIVFSLVSCWSQDIKTIVEDGSWKLNEAKWVVQDTRDVINDYADTLEWSIRDAREVKDQYEQNSQKLQEDIKNAYK